MKAFSQSGSSYLNDIAFSHSRLIDFAAPLDNKELLSAIKTGFTFTVVRHPFTRLVSAFR